VERVVLLLEREAIEVRRLDVSGGVIPRASRGAVRSERVRRARERRVQILVLGVVVDLLLRGVVQVTHVRGRHHDLRVPVHHQRLPRGVHRGREVLRGAKRRRHRVAVAVVAVAAVAAVLRQEVHRVGTTGPGAARCENAPRVRGTKRQIRALNEK
jgi:hypothetical protein